MQLNLFARSCIVRSHSLQCIGVKHSSFLAFALVGRDCSFSRAQHHDICSLCLGLRPCCGAFGMWPEAGLPVWRRSALRLVWTH